VAKHADRIDDAPEDGGMLVSEERIQVSTRTVPIGRARLQRVVVTERRTIEVDVRHEEIRLVEDDGPEYGELATGEGRARATPWVVLREERLEVVRHVEPTERVRLVLDQVSETVPVTADLRHEVLDVRVEDLRDGA
jgi:uncharacterized protein (TIGR02271 family)